MEEKYSKAYSGSDEISFIEGDVFMAKIPLKDIFIDVTDNVTNGKKKYIIENRLVVIINEIKKNNKISLKDLSILLDASRMTVFRDIEKLKKQKKIKRIGSAKGGCWEIIING